jgi:hypothetical protein
MQTQQHFWSTPTNGSIRSFNAVTRANVGGSFDVTGQEAKMFIKIALSAAIVMASAATKSNKIAVHRSGPPAQSTVPRAPRFSNPDSPAATGGGSLGYNQNIYNW